MKKKGAKNYEIKGIGDKVLNAVRLPDEEIDRIAGAPYLFDRVRAGIAEQTAVETPDPSPGWTFRYAFGAVFAVLVLAAGFGMIDVARQYLAAPDLASGVEVITPDAALDEDLADLPYVPETEATPAVFHRASKPRKREISRKPDDIKTARARNEREMGEFQALTYAGETGEPGEGGRIVRVELSPASLFAMGIDVPVENSAEKVRADLLISADGVMTGVRLEKKN
jgi:hypothetical protein